jgi:MFS family permease
LDPYAPFRSRDYRFLLTGSFLASFGSQMLSVAVSWDLYIQTRSALALGNVGLVQVAPFLVFALFAGHMADRYDRRHILVLMQIPMLASAAALSFSRSSVALIYACLFVNAMARAFQGPARQAILSHTVPEGVLTRAITWNSSAQEIASVSGPALAGLLIAATGSRAVYLVQLGCALMTLGCFYGIRHRGAPVVSTLIPTTQDLLEGVRFVWSDKLILSALSLDLFAVLFGGATALLPIYAVDILHSGARGLGLLRAAPAVGAVGMALLLAHSPRIKNAGSALLFAVCGFGVASILFGLSRSLWLSFAMLLLTGAFDNVSVVLRNSLVQMRTPDRVRGRVMAINNIFISCSNQLGAVESGWTAAWFGAVGSVVAGGAATVTIVSMFTKWARELREWKQIPG